MKLCNKYAKKKGIDMALRNIVTTKSLNLNHEEVAVMAVVLPCKTEIIIP